MFQKLRRKFITIAMFSVTVVLIGIIAILNLFYFLQLNRDADDVLNFLLAHNGSFPEDSFSYNNRHNLFSGETPYRTRYFSVSFNTESGETAINMGHIASILPSEAYNYALTVADSGKTQGIYRGYKYKIKYTNTGYEIVFLDFGSELTTLRTLILLSLLILFVSLIIIFVLISLLSRPIINPVIENIQKQKRFITDASHEIKTPLSIISADTDVIEILHGEDEWTQNIKDQVVRMNDLVKDLLILSKMESAVPSEIVTKFNASEVISKRADTFDPIAVSENKHYIKSIEKDVEFKGYEDGIDKLVSVLLNNSFKYTPEDGTISLNVSKQGKSIIIVCSNTTDKMPSGNLNRLFDRFYRSDNSRSRETGSYGIGLSIAKAVVEQHKGNISVEKVNRNLISFRAVLNQI